MITIVILATILGAVPATEHISVLRDLAGGPDALPVESVALPDGAELDLSWIAAILGFREELVRFGDSHPGGQAKALFTADGGKARWLDPAGKLWAHVEYSERPLGGNSLFAPQKEAGRLCYACQWRDGKRHGWQIYVHGFVLATQFEADKPLVTHEVRGGRVVETWKHKSKEKPSAELQKRFREAETTGCKEFRKELLKMRSQMLDWIEQGRKMRANALAAGRRRDIIGRNDFRDQAQLRAHLSERLRHIRAPGRAPFVPQ